MAEKTPAGRGVLKRGIQLPVSGAVMAAVMFMPAGRSNRWQACTYLAIFVGAIAFNALFILRRDPGLERPRGPKLGSGPNYPDYSDLTG